MIEKSVEELNFVHSNNPMPTVEVDIDSIPEQFYGYSDLITQGIKSFVESSPECKATLYIYQGNSVNFHTQTYSAFIGIVGNKKDELLELILKSFQKVSGIQARYSDYITESMGMMQFHIEGGKVWRPSDAMTWETNDDHNDESDIESEEAVEENDGKRNSTPLRYRAARSDTTIGVIKNKIETTFGLPEGSVSLCGPDGKSLRSDARISTLRDRWE